MPREKRPRDPNALAHFAVGRLTGTVKLPREPLKDPAAVELGRKGGLRGGKARAKTLTKARRSEIAALAAAARWGKQAKQK
jgi:hypothetical protein